MNKNKGVSKMNSELPDKSYIKNIIIISLIFLDIFNIQVIRYVEFRLLKHTINDFKMLTIWSVYLFLNFWACVILINKEKFAMQFFLFIGVLYSLVSIYYLYLYYVYIHIVVKIQTLMDLYIVLGGYLVIVYLLFNISVNGNRRRRGRNGLRPIKYYLPFSTLGAILGVILSIKASGIKTKNFEFISLAFVHLILAYILILLSQYIYKFIVMKLNTKKE